MFHGLIVRSIGIVLCSAGGALAQDPPPLEGPVTDPAPNRSLARTAPAPAPTAGKFEAPRPAGPMLVIPGVTVPSSRSAATTRSPVSRAGPSTSPGSPDLTGPSPTPAARASSGPGSPSGMPAQRDRQPSTLNAVPLTLEPLDDEPSRAEDRGGGGIRPDSAARSPKPDSPADSTAAPGGRRATPWRMPGFLGRVIGPLPAGRSRAPAANGDAAIRAKTKAEPDADAVLKRRIEQQIRTTLADKVRSVEVRVNGRNVLIVARSSRFWQKRTVQRTLETLPALAGYRARIELDN
jgi:hypothetical protein